MGIERSPAMIRAAYFMALHGEPKDDGSLSPPTEMGVGSWTEAYRWLFPQLAHGRPFETFKGSIDKDRRHYLACLAGRKSDSEDRRAILGEFPRLSRAEQWAEVQSSLGNVNPAGEITYPDEVADSPPLFEGAVTRVTVNAYERNPDARQQCIAEFGTACCVCKFDFGVTYGPVAKGYIHVHHLRPLAEIGESYIVNPIADLRPVCPNCHAVIHLGGGCRTIEEVQRLLRMAPE